MVFLILGDFVLEVQDGFKVSRVEVVKIHPLFFGVYLQVVLYVFLDGRPYAIHVDGTREDVDATEAVSVDVQDHIL